MPKIERTCQSCGSVFYRWPSDVKRGNGNYCSFKCRLPWNKGKKNAQLAWNKGLKTQQVACQCEVCGKEFVEYVSGIKEGRGKLCSRDCYNRQYIPLNKGLIGVMPSGEKCHLWKGGITPETRSLRASTEYKLWRNSVFIRDNYTCIWCGQVGGLIEADHIEKWSVRPDLRFAIDNGRTLCKKCHKLRHTNNKKI